MDNHKLHESSEGLSLISQFGSLGLCLRKPVLGSLDSFDENLSDKNPASLSCAPSLHPPLRKIEDFVELLQSTRLSGPVLFTDKRTLIGKGSQFAVFKCKMAGGALIAIKQPLFFLEPDRELNLADSKVSQQIHDMYLEVLALCHPTLRTHPNIVRLQAWGRDDFIWHEPPVLVLELAASDLKIFMSETEDCLLKKGEDIALWKLKHRLCLDIAAGLDAIHECQLIHGDLKPENILIFEQDDGVIAKLADFGLSLDEAVCDPSFAISGTPGWRAPEVEEGSVKATELPQADNYTYGLVAWSILLLKGDTPPKSQNIDRANLLTEMLKESSSRIPTLLRNLVPKRLLQVMELKPSLRPLRVAESLSTNDGNHDKWLRDHASYLHKAQSPHEMNADEEKFVQYDWELEPVSYQLCTSLQSRFQHDPDSLSPATKLSLAFQSSLASTSNEHTFGLLYSTASLGDARAKALISSVYCRTEEFLKREAPDVMQNTVNFLRHAIITGATICFQQLKHLDTIMFEEARSQFHLRGGYNQFYTPESYDDSDPSFEQSKSSRLHWLAAYGTYEEVADYINLQPDHDINSMTATYETPLYLACMRGDLKITKILLQNGADPSIQCGPFDLTGLHWLFAFDENNHQEAACDLIAYGSNIDAYTSCVVPFYHFPFSLPPGTPLHWAITLKNDSAVKTLLALGANALFRNATDPYMWDELVRELNLHGGPNQELYSAFNEDALGLSPLDIASSDRYAYPFQYILQNSPITLNINDRDEEDYTIVHRLGDSFIGSTRLDVTYDKRAFRGSSEYQAKALSETILAIKALGGDLNAFTRQSRLGSTWNAFHHVGRSGLTPLMLSTLVGDLQLATELIKSGADIQRKNEQGMIAVLGIFFGPLFAILTTRKVALDMIKLLSAYGADLKARTPRNGTSILVLAAGSGALDIVEFLLELDVSTDNRYDAMEQYWDHSNNCSFWATLVRPQRYISLKGYLPYDREVCRLLQKYLLAESDVIRRRHLMEDVYRRGWSLLHYYVYHRMPQSTRALLDAGCAVNIVSIGSISAFLGLTERRSFKATPLDIALKAKADTSHKLQGPKMALVDSLYNQIIKTLKDKGAKTLSELQEPTAKPPLEHDFLQI